MGTRPRDLFLAIARETKSHIPLYAEIRTLADQGTDKEFVLSELYAALEALTLPDEDEADDAIRDTMDFVAGFCSEHARIRSNDAK